MDKNKYFYDVDFEKHKIYVIDSVEDIRSFFMKYGNFSQSVSLHRHFGHEHMGENSEVYLKYLRKMELIENFLENLHS